jgi:hypothetical protein
MGKARQSIKKNLCNAATREANTATTSHHA